jgi:hypothetical protein
MDEFFSYFAVEDQFPLLIYGFICQAIDRLLAGYKSDEDQAMLKEIYSAENYLRYYIKEKAATG